MRPCAVRITTLNAATDAAGRTVQLVHVHEDDWVKAYYYVRRGYDVWHSQNRQKAERQFTALLAADGTEQDGDTTTL